MKRLQGIIGIFLMLSLTACTVTSNPTTATPNVGSTAASTSQSHSEMPPCPGIDETVIYDSEIITITVIGMEFNSTYKTYVVKTIIQNHSDRTISYSLDWVNVNGYTIGALVFGDVYGGMEATADFGFARDELQLAHIQAIQEVSFTFDCKYDDSGETICSASTTLLTSDYGTQTEEYSVSGTEVYSSDDYTIVIAPTNNPSVRHPFEILVENHTDCPVAIMYDDIAINTQMVADYMSGPYALPNSRRIEIVNIVYFGDEPEIESIEFVSLRLNILPYRSDGSFSTADVIEVPETTITFEELR